jgi:DDE superfamily endonuclease
VSPCRVAKPLVDEAIDQDPPHPPRASRCFSTLPIPIDRVAADRPFYSGKHRKHGMNLQVIADPDGDIVWVSGPLPGAVHDLTAARIWGIVRALAASGLVVLGDKGYAGEDDIRTRTGAGTSPHRRRRPTGLMPGSALPANAPMPSSSPGASCASSAAAPGVLGN